MIKVCSRCIYTSKITGISFDSNGVCSYCNLFDQLKQQYGTGTKKGERLFRDIIQDIKRAGRKKPYDCVIGVSGGTDSSYLLLKAKEWSLRPLAVHYDNTWNSAVATINIARVTDALGIDLMTYVVNNKEVDDIKRAFLLAGVREFDADTDLGFAQVLRKAACKFGIKYILEGHSFVTEGLSPVGDNYCDGRYIRSIHKQFGRLNMKSFPNMSLIEFLKWSVVYRQKFIRPLWYIEYSKEAARRELSSKTGWQYYSGHHLENRASSFAHTVWLPQRFEIDYRLLTLAADVRRGKLSRPKALSMLDQEISVEPELIRYVKKRLDLSDEEYLEIMLGKSRTWREFKTYKKYFEVLRPLFFLLANANLVPRSFYLKYCFPVD